MSATDIPQVSTELDTNIIKEITLDESKHINDPPQPTPKNDLFNQMKVDELVLTDAGPSETIDVIPDFRIITYQLIDHCTKIYDQIDQNQFPAVTPASLLAYMLQTIYAYGTMNDVWIVRQYSSPFGIEFLNQTNHEQTLTQSIYNCTPPFVQDIIKGLNYSFDPRRCNLAYIYSFAAYAFDYDFGRIYPIHMFLALHNIIATAPKDATESLIWTQWLNYTVVEDEEGTEIKVSNIIGAAIDISLHTNFIVNKLRTLLSPVLTVGNRQARPKFTPFNFQEYVVEEFSDINPYHYLTGWNTQMEPIIIDFMNQMKAICFPIFKNSKYLGELFGTETGTQIMNHYYSDPLLPTYHSVQSFVTPSSTVISSEKYAAKLNYMCTKCDSKTLTEIISPPPGVIPELYLRTREAAKTDPDQKLEFDIRKHKQPQVLLYSPYSTGKSSLYFPLTTGLTIESFELDGFHVPQPRIDTSIKQENSYLLNSCIPIQATIGRKDLDGKTTLPIYSRSFDDIDETKVSLSLYDMANHRLPYYPTAIWLPSESNFLPGFTPAQGIQRFSTASNKICYEHDDIATSNDSDHICKALYCWSSYRWINRSYVNTARPNERTYYLMNFRTLYGTTPQMFLSPPLYNIIK